MNYYEIVFGVFSTGCYLFFSLSFICGVLPEPCQLLVVLLFSPPYDQTHMCWYC